MAWAKVDDGWWCHPKVLGLTLEARGLWVTALSWSCAQRRDVIPAAFVSMVGGHDGDVLSKELVDAGLWHDTPEGWVVHDWCEYQERPQQEASESGSYGNHIRWHVNRGVVDEQCAHCRPRLAPDSPPISDATPNPIAPGPSHPNPEEHSSSPEGDAAAETGADDAADQDAPDDEVDERFEEHFWPHYPPMPNGKKPEKGKALQQWRKLTLDQQRRAVRGAKHLARADTIPKHAHRFLRKDTAGEFPFDDWQDGPTAPTESRFFGGVPNE